MLCTYEYFNKLYLVLYIIYKGLKEILENFYFNNTLFKIIT